MATQQSTSSKKQSGPAKGGNANRSSGPAPASSSGAAERDEVYGLVSVLYHSLQGAETYGKYIEDARRGGDQELQQFFQNCQAEENERATEAKRLLALRLEEFADEGADDEDEDEDEEDEEDED